MTHVRRHHVVTCLFFAQAVGNSSECDAIEVAACGRSEREIHVPTASVRPEPIAGERVSESARSRRRPVIKADNNPISSGRPPAYRPAVRPLLFKDRLFRTCVGAHESNTKTHAPSGGV